MLWEKSIIAGKKRVQCLREESLSTKNQSSRQSKAWFQSAASLEKKAQIQKNKGNIDGAIELIQKGLEIRRTTLSKRCEGKLDSSKAKIGLARPLVELGRLLVMKEKKSQAEECFKEAMRLYSSSGALAKNHASVRELKIDIDKLNNSRFWV